MHTTRSKDADDIVSIPGDVDVNECQQFCIDDPRCVAIEYENRTSIAKRCWHFLDDVNDLEPYDKTDVYVLTRCDECVYEWDVSTNRSIRDNAQLIEQRLSLEQCRKKCIQTDCFAIDYDVSGKFEYACAIMQNEPPRPWAWFDIPFLDLHRFLGCAGASSSAATTIFSTKVESTTVGSTSVESTTVGSTSEVSTSGSTVFSTTPGCNEFRLIGEMWSVNLTHVSLKGGTFDECKELCLDDDTCVGIEWHENLNTLCTLHTEETIVNLEDATDFFTYRLDRCDESTVTTTVRSSTAGTTIISSSTGVPSTESTESPSSTVLESTTVLPSTGSTSIESTSVVSTVVSTTDLPSSTGSGSVCVNYEWEIIRDMWTKAGKVVRGVNTESACLQFCLDRRPDCYAVEFDTWGRLNEKCLWHDEKEDLDFTEPIDGTTIFILNCKDDQCTYEWNKYEDTEVRDGVVELEMEDVSRQKCRLLCIQDRNCYGVIYDRIQNIYRCKFIMEAFRERDHVDTNLFDLFVLTRRCATFSTSEIPTTSPGASTPASSTGGTTPASSTGGTTVPASSTGGTTVPPSTPGGSTTVPPSTPGGSTTVPTTAGGGSTVVSTSQVSTTKVEGTTFVSSTVPSSSFASTAASTVVTSTEAPSTQSPATSVRPDCEADVVFLVDSSGSIRDAGVENWGIIKMFLGDVVRRAGQVHNNFAVVAFSDIVRVDVTLDDNDDIFDIIDNMHHIAFKTNTPLAIQTMFDEVLVEEAGDRPKVPDVIVLITDGEVNPEYQTGVQAAVDRMVESNAKVLGVAITDQADRDLLLEMTSDELIFDLEDFSDLESAVNSVSANMCPDQATGSTAFSTESTAQTSGVTTSVPSSSSAAASSSPTPSSPTSTTEVSTGDCHMTETMYFNSDGASLATSNGDKDDCMELCLDNVECVQANYDFDKERCYIREFVADEIYPATCCVHFERVCGSPCEERFITAVNQALSNEPDPLNGVDTSDECADACLADDRCAGYSWERTELECRLAFGRAYTLLEEEDYDFYTRIRCLD